MKKHTINDIAEIAGVSKTTVSRYLNGHFNKMSAETKENIANIIEELDYQPNRQAQGLKSSKSYFLGVILADIEESYSSALTKAIQDAISQTNYQLLVMYTNNSKEKELEALERLLHQKIDGLMIQPVTSQLADLKALQSSQIPTVLIDRKLNQSLWPVVQTDNTKSILQIGQRLKEKQYQRIIHISHAIDQISPRIERYDAIQKVGKQQNIEVQLLEIDNEQSIIEFLTQDHSKAKTAIFASNGNVLYQVLLAVLKLNLSIPQDYGLFGYDDGQLGRIVSPGITGIYQNIQEIGRNVADLLLKQINGYTDLQDIIVDTAIIERSSL